MQEKPHRPIHGDAGDTQHTYARSRQQPSTAHSKQTHEDHVTNETLLSRTEDVAERTVITRLDERSYEVDTPTGTYRRNRVHLRKSSNLSYTETPESPDFDQADDKSALQCHRRHLDLRIRQALCFILKEKGMLIMLISMCVSTVICIRLWRQRKWPFSRTYNNPPSVYDTEESSVVFISHWSYTSSCLRRKLQRR